MTELIVALDDPDLAGAEAMAKELEPYVDAFKVGLTLYLKHGPDAIKSIGRHGRVLCDVKLNDIPAQVAGAAEAVATHGAWMLTVHALAGCEAVKAAVDGVRRSGGTCIVAGVTVLTSLSSEDARELHLPDPSDHAPVLATLAVESGAGAVVCSASEARAIKSVAGSAALVVPGVRPAGSKDLDQSRTSTPLEAANAGATYIVVGRPITTAANPVETAQAIQEELKGAK